ncbi:hypothetical protein IMG5_050010 [Ichthyophthirius multifiliis]|uniref:Uncharacterized protein n=1 Tax=Ichthyophthirius multifiliis TaxID=5932 RepID=G0QMM2_ICHMU|nr:hypothetical protein IMG5_050010 [Ichthyophthirius multifiliis]EGR33541.1 hypothetical protein IMG5_050010 [Ichthyophthirius multifiliis]|eukprot:XP_004037527.1 hypothetical protein IMG5_050010 [Ichthyophthirius multifiliis]
MMRCQYKNHYNQIKNIVCLCEKEALLLCVYCFQDGHQNHQFMGIEKYLDKIRNTYIDIQSEEIQIENQKQQLKYKYDYLQLKITELSQNLEILLHQIKTKSEQQMSEFQQMHSKMALFQIKLTKDPLNEQYIQESLTFSQYINQQLKNETTLFHQYEIQLYSIQEIIQQNIQKIQERQKNIIINSKINSDSHLLYTKSILHAHNNRINSFLLQQHNILYTCSLDGTLKKWSLNTIKCLAIQKCDSPNFYLNLIIIENQNILVALRNDNKVHILNLRTLKIIKTIKIPWNQTSCPQLIKGVNKKSHHIAVSAGTKIFILDILLGKIIFETETQPLFLSILLISLLMENIHIQLLEIKQVIFVLMKLILVER